MYERNDNESLVYDIQHGCEKKNDLIEKLWCNNIKLIRKIIHECTGLSYYNAEDIQDLEDLEQQSFLGFADAIQGYDCNSGVKFFTYARFHIKHSIYQYYDRAGQTIRVPAHMRKHIKDYRNAEVIFSQSGEKYKQDYIENKLGITKTTLRSTELAMTRMQLVSVDAPLDPSDPERGALINNISDQNQDGEKACDSVYLQELHKFLVIAIRKLPEVEKQIIIARYYQGYSIGKIASCFGCTRQNVSKHLQKAYRKMRCGKNGKILSTFLPEKAYLRVNRVSKNRKKNIQVESEFLI